MFAVGLETELSLTWDTRLMQAINTKELPRIIIIKFDIRKQDTVIMALSFEFTYDDAKQFQVGQKKACSCTWSVSHLGTTKLE